MSSKTAETPENAVAANPFDRQTHDSVIRQLRPHKKTRFAELFQARLAKHQYFLFSQTDINETLEDILAVPDDAQRREGLDAFFSVLIVDFPCVFYWIQYLELCGAGKSDQELQLLYTRALNDCIHDYANSPKVWALVLAAFEQVFVQSGDAGDLDRLWKLHLKRLSYPHHSLAESFADTSKFVSTHFPDDYEAYMTKATKVHSSTAKNQRYYDKYEIAVAKDPSSPENWKDYLEMLSKYSRGDHRAFSSVFYRSLLAESGDWSSVWLSYIYQLYKLEEGVLKVSLLENVLVNFCKRYPDSCVSYGQLVRNCHLLNNGAALYEIARTRIDALDLMHKSPYNDWKVLALSILSYENSIDGSSRLGGDIERFFSFAVDKNSDIFHSVEKLCIEVYESKGKLDDAKRLVGILLEKFEDQCELWLYTLDFFRRNDFDYSHKSNLLKSAVEHIDKLDWPERIIEEQLRFESVFGDTSTYQDALLAADSVMRRMYLKELEEQTQEQSPTPETSKRPVEQPDEPNKRPKVEPTRNREELSVKVKNLPKDCSEGTLKSVFEDCGTIKDIMVYETGNTSEAIIELDDERAVMSALTKSLKTVGSHQIEVERLLNSIVWVTNFPPGYTEASIKDLFGEIGKVVSVRFPVQSGPKERRFCYVEFSSPESAHLAIAEFNGRQVESYKMVVKLSDKNVKKKVPVAKREVYISNLSFSCGEDDIRAFFEECGSLESIILPLKDEMRAKNHKNSGFGFVVFHSQSSVNAALKLNGSKLKGRPLNIHISKKNATKPPQNDPSRTVTLRNLPPTNVEDLSSFLRSLDLPYTDIHLNSKSNTAEVVFASVPETGKASLKLESQTFKDTVISVGSSRPQFVPPALRRRR